MSGASSNSMDNVSDGYTFLKVLGLVLISYSSSLVIYRLFFHPLAAFPGPKLAAVTGYYEAYYDVIEGGQYTFKIADLHQKLGIFLRRPHTVKNTSDELLKVPSYASARMSCT